jgi:hypothetical protein
MKPSHQMVDPDEAQDAMRPLLGVPDDLAVIDIMLFGPPAKSPYNRWKKTLSQIVNWDRFDMANHMTAARIDEWVKEQRHKVMYRDEKMID